MATKSKKPTPVAPQLFDRMSEDIANTVRAELPLFRLLGENSETVCRKLGALEIHHALCDKS